LTILGNIKRHMCALLGTTSKLVIYKWP